jgi:hypothetical protein
MNKIENKIDGAANANLKLFLIQMQNGMMLYII